MCHKKQDKTNYIHGCVWLKRLQFLLKYSHHLQPALIGILKEKNTCKLDCMHLKKILIICTVLIWKVRYKCVLWQSSIYSRGYLSPAAGTVPGPPSLQTAERPCEETAAKWWVGGSMRSCPWSHTSHEGLMMQTKIHNKLKCISVFQRHALKIPFTSYLLWYTAMVRLLLKIAGHLHTWGGTKDVKVRSHQLPQLRHFPFIWDPPTV